MFSVNKYVYVIAIFVVNTVALGRDEAFIPRLSLTVYYESNCPDSKSFILNQLKPAMKLLEEFIILRMVPFGKSRSIDYGYGGFECQHGPAECLGNMVQDCSLSKMLNRPDRDKVEYVACEMATQAGSRGSYQCVEQANLSVDSVNNCVKYGEGVELQLDSEYWTSRIRPKFIPTITIDDQFNQQFQDHAFMDLIDTLCSILKDTRACAQYYNNMALHHLLGLSYVTVEQ